MQSNLPNLQPLPLNWLEKTINEKLKKSIQTRLEKVDIQINGSRPWDIQVHNERLYQRVLLHGSLGLGEAYMEGWWDCPQLDQFFVHILRGNLHEEVAPRNLSSLSEAAIAGITNLQSLARSFQVGEEHYDLGNDLFQDMLDKRMTYTCAYWENAKTLDEAQEAKLDLVCQKLHLKPGMTLLDIGCGWGSLIKYAAEKYGVSCVGLTVSKEQVKLGEEMCQGLPIKFLLQDYRTFEGQKFDRIASIGMFEHVGYKNFRTFMEMSRCCLKEDGLFLLHTIGSLKTNMSGENWAMKYIFPNGYLPSLAQISKATEELLVLEDLQNIGHHYHPTFMAYLENFDRHWPKLKEKYGEEFYRKWKYFLCSIGGSFGARHSQVWQMVFSPNGVLQGYQSIR
ncbi:MULTISPECIES: cyclopropane fatty acyl phospholipid synthase [Spirulina sp. CCY15215]|uniref:cyclopropane fatty acyl phospholipid synthase n=1 Tax=Spirulina sp. CCY15215 TaxID=2767591 RepID=UPI0019517531|nr:cyclopropane fatty acyl phospholipid synthase [Spirulina major]